MAIGTITETAALSDKSYPTGSSLYVSFAGDGTYAAGGTANFQASVRSDLGVNATVKRFECDIVNSGGYIYAFDPATGKLACYYCTNNGGAAGPLVEDTTADQSGRTVAGWLILG